MKGGEGGSGGRISGTSSERGNPKRRKEMNPKETGKES